MNASYPYCYASLDVFAHFVNQRVAKPVNVIKAYYCLF